MKKELLPGFPYLAGQVGVDLIINLACEVCHSTRYEFLFGNQRGPRAKAARKLAAYVAMRQTPFSAAELSPMFKRDSQGSSVRSYSNAYGGLLVNKNTCLEASQRLTELGRRLRELEG